MNVSIVFRDNQLKFYHKIAHIANISTIDNERDYVTLYDDQYNVLHEFCITNIARIIVSEDTKKSRFKWFRKCR